MGHIRPHAQVLPVLVAFSAYPEALAWGIEWARNHWGLIALTSVEFDFVQTDYYQDSMGSGLKKILLAPDQLLEADHLPAMKLATNQAEAELSSGGNYPVARPLNLDPGYLNLSKFVLASTKDHAHRIYVGQGIFAELTLRYQSHGWQPLPWTYPDYREPHYHSFLTDCRGHYRRLCLR